MEDDYDTEKGGSRPATGGSRPATGGSRPATEGSRPATGGSRPGSGGSRPGSGNAGSRPGSGVVLAGWEEEKEPDVTSLSTLEEAEDEEDDEPLVKSEDDIPKGCWFGFMRSFMSIWSTKEINDDFDREDIVRTTVRELLLYVMFLTIICIMLFTGTSNYRHPYTNMMKLHLEKIEKVDQISDFWEYLIDEMVPSIYQTKWYNDGDNPMFPCPDGSTGGPCERSEEDANMLYDNKMLGVPRFRQLRVRNDSCEVHPLFQASITACYSDYEEAKEDKNPFGPGIRKFTSPDAWRYQSAKEIGGSEFWGKLKTYSGGGSVQNLHPEEQQTLAIIRELREFLWIDRATRIIIVDFTTYNANVNLFCVTKLVFEFPPTGGIIRSQSYQVTKLLRYVSENDHWVLAYETVFFLFVIYYLVEEILEIKKLKGDYFDEGWNIMDLLVIFVSIFCCSITLYTDYVVKQLLKPLLAEPTLFGDFSTLAWWNDLQNNIFAINVFFAWLKVFKYISFNRTMQQLSTTIARCAPDVMAFGFMFQIIFMAYAQFGYLLFGPKLYDFSKMSYSAYTLMRTMLGDFDFPALQGAHPVFGPGFFIFFIFVVFFILLNMFLAIINDTYSEVKAEMEMTRIQFEITDLFARGYNNFLGSVAMRDKMIDVENAIKLANDDGVVTFEEIRMELKKCDFSNAEIEMFFGNSDKDGDGIIDIEEANDAVEDLEDDIDLLTGVDEDGEKPDDMEIVTNKEFDVLEYKVNKMEHSVGSILSKIEIVLEQLSLVEVKKDEPTGEDAGNAAFMLDMSDQGGIADFVPGDGSDGNATFL